MTEGGSEIPRTTIEACLPTAGVDTYVLTDEKEAPLLINLEASPLAVVNGFEVIAQIAVAGKEPLYVVHDKLLRHTEDGKLIQFAVTSAAVMDGAEPVTTETIGTFNEPDDAGYMWERFDDGIEYYRHKEHSQGPLTASIWAQVGDGYRETDAIASKRKLRIKHNGKANEAIEVTHKLDEANPVHFILAHRQRRNLNLPDDLEPRKSIQERLVERILAERGSSRWQRSDHFYDGLIVELLKHDMAFIDDTARIHPDRVEEVGEAIASLEDNQDEQIIQAVREHHEASRKHRKIASTLLGMAQVGAVYVDNKYNGALLHASRLSMDKPFSHLGNLLFWTSVPAQIRNLLDIHDKGRELKRIDRYEDDIRPYNLTNLKSFEKNAQFSELEFIWRVYRNRHHSLKTIVHELHNSLAKRI